MKLLIWIYRIKHKRGENMNGKYGIGIMSGTSLDGIDVVWIKIDGYGLDTNLQVVAFDTIPFNVELRNKIKNAFQ